MPFTTIADFIASGFTSVALAQDDFKPYWAPYEFVDLVALRVEVFPAACSGGYLCVGLFDNEVDAPTDVEGVLKLPYSTMTFLGPGSPPLTLSYSGPGFGRVLKGGSHGNAVPSVALGAGGLPTGVRQAGAYKITIEWSGRGTDTRFIGAHPAATANADAAPATE